MSEISAHGVDLDELSQPGTTFMDVYGSSQPEHCHWSGQKYLESAVADAVVRRPHEHDSISHLEAESHAALVSFPYHEYRELLGPFLSATALTNISLRFSNERQAFLAMVGTISLRGSDKKRSLLDKVLAEQIQLCMPSRSSTGALIQTRSSLVPRVHSGSPVDQDERTAFKLRRSMSALYECGDKDGRHPAIVREIQLSDQPHSFRAVLQFRGRIFEAIAGSKKLARQAAALKACIAFEIATT